jgi:single-strand DNA-binding protein
MASFNKVVLVGNVTRDPELRYIASGTAVTDIGLAVNDRRKTATGEWVEETTFVDVTLWGRTAEVAGEYVTKGSPLLIEGRLKLDTWEKDGKKNSKLRVVCERMQLLGGRGEGGRGGAGVAGAGKSRAPARTSGGEEEYAQASGYDGPDDVPAAGGGDDDIPF